MSRKHVITSVLVFVIIIFNQSLAGADEFPVVVEAEVRAVLSAEQAGVLSMLKVDLIHGLLVSYGWLPRNDSSLLKKWHIFHVPWQNLDFVSTLS